MFDSQLLQYAVKIIHRMLDIKIIFFFYTERSKDFGDLKCPPIGEPNAKLPKVLSLLGKLQVAM